MTIIPPQQVQDAYQGRGRSEGNDARAERIGREVDEAGANSGTILPWATRLVAGVIAIVTVGTAVTMLGDDSPLWVLLLVAVGGFGASIALLKWGEDAPERRRRARLSGR